MSKQLHENFVDEQVKLLFKILFILKNPLVIPFLPDKR